MAGAFVNSGNSEQISCKWRGGKKEVFADDSPYEKVTDHIGKYPAVMIAPDDTELINGGSELRRKWIDSILCQSDKNYFELLIRYQHVLQQRNAWLKLHFTSAAPPWQELEFYNQTLSQDAQYLHKSRWAFIEQFQKPLAYYYAMMSGGSEMIGLHYHSSLNDKPLSLLLEQNLQHDLRLQRTVYGIHRDELEFLLEGQSLKNFGSQGQKKSFLFALKLAQYDFLTECCGQKPILLLDDVFEKLDQGRMESLLGIIRDEKFGQVILTDTHAERVLSSFGGHQTVCHIAL